MRRDSPIHLERPPPLARSARSYDAVSALVSLAERSASPACRKRKTDGERMAKLPQPKWMPHTTIHSGHPVGGLPRKALRQAAPLSAGAASGSTQQPPIRTQPPGPSTPAAVDPYDFTAQRPHSREVEGKHRQWQAALAGALQKAPEATRALIAPATYLDPIGSMLLLRQLTPEQVESLTPAEVVHIVSSFREKTEAVIFSNPVLSQALRLRHGAARVGAGVATGAAAANC